MDATGVTATDDAATSAGARPGVTPAARADAAAARPAAFFESDADLPALRVVGPRDDGSAAVSRAVDAGVFAFARAAEGSSFFATEAGEMRSISMTSASGSPRQKRARDTEAGLVFSLPSLAGSPAPPPLASPVAAARASARSARVLFFPEDAGCSESFSFARAGDASANARGAVVSAEGDSAFLRPARPPRPRRLAAGFSPFSLSASADARVSFAFAFFVSSCFLRLVSRSLAR
jgi:hypothetical protein